MILDTHNGMELTLRPMKYPEFYQAYKDAINNNWSVNEVNLGADREHLLYRLTPSETNVVKRLVAFFATGDSIVSNNLVLTLYKHVNSPEARLYYSRQLFEESVHVDQYLLLVDAYIPDPEERNAAYAAVENIPSIKRKADFMQRWIDSVETIDKIKTDDDKRKFLMVLITFAAAVEGLFFMGAFSYVYYLRSRGLLPALAEATNWIFRDESGHMNFAFDIVDTCRREQPELFTDELRENVIAMLTEGIECEMQFSDDMFELGLPGFTRDDMHDYLKFCADQRLIRMGYEPVFGGENRLAFMELQDIVGMTNFFERRVTEYQAAVVGDVAFEDDF